MFHFDNSVCAPLRDDFSSSYFILHGGFNRKGEGGVGRVRIELILTPDLSATALSIPSILAEENNRRVRFSTLGSHSGQILGPE